MTGERFVPNPIAPERSQRLYRTGDLGRWRSAGEIEYLGRMDGEVKVRGMRIDLGEIETVLASHRWVEEAVVELSGEGAEQRLVAYVVAGEEGTPSARELRRYVRSKLPEHMAPASYVRVEELPLLPSGKVDRRALKIRGCRAELGEIEAVLGEPPAVRAAAGVRGAGPGGHQLWGYAAPGTELERKLAGIWADVLKLERVSVHDNFFDLGGHSLLAVKLVAHVEKVLGKMLPVISIFQSPTVSELAVLLSTPGSQEK